MKITPNELMAMCKWAEYCDLTGTNVHAVKEGSLDGDDELPLTVEQGYDIKIIKNEINP